MKRLSKRPDIESTHVKSRCRYDRARVGLDISREKNEKTQGRVLNLIEMRTRTSKEKSKWNSIKRLELRKARLVRTGRRELLMMEIKSVT